MVVIVPILIILALVQLFIGLGILFESRRSKQTHQKIFVGLLAVILIWTLAVTILTYVDSHARPNNLWYFNVVNRIGFLTGALSLTVAYLFNLFYPIRKRALSYRRAILWFGVALAALAPTDLVAGRFSFVDNSLHFEYGALAYLLAFYSVVVIASIAIDSVILYRSAANSQTKSQAITLLVGLVLTVMHTIVFVLVLPSLFKENVVLYGIGYLGPYYYTGVTAYSLLRQGLFNVRAVVVRSVAYVFAVGVLGIVFAGAVFLISKLFLQEALSLRQAIAFSTVSVVVALVYQPLIPLFNRITNKLFYRDAYDAQAFIDELNKILVSTIHLSELLDKASDLIVATLKVNSCIFVLEQRGQPIVAGTKRALDSTEARLCLKQMASSNETAILTSDLPEHGRLKMLLDDKGVDVVAQLIDIKHDSNRMGCILLGEKKSGSSFNSQDLQVINIVSNELVIAVQNALRFQEIENFNATLQEKVTDATKKLRHTNEKLRMLDETKDDFISMASHQLRTPLTSVKGYVSMVLDGDAGKISPLQRKLLNQSFVSSQRMVYLISDLLNLSRLRTGKFIIEATPCNLADIIKGEIEQLKETAKGRNLELEYVKPEHFPTYMLDETKLRQVIMNFVDNAIYYTPAGGHITVNLVERPTTIEFTVVDNGIGVPKAEQHHLFAKFYRANNAKRARPDGTGLGLFMAKKVVIAQGGAIIFKSQEGKGSTFGFSFAKDRLEEPTK